MFDLTGPQRPWPDSLLRRFGAAVDAALGTFSPWGPPSPGGDPWLLDVLHDRLGAPLGRTVVTAGVRHFAASVAGTVPRVVIERPGFQPLAEIFRTSGGHVTEVGWEDLPASVADEETNALVWVTSPLRNPDGAELPDQLVTDLTDLSRRGHQVILNQAYGWYGNAIHNADLWTVHSLSKLCGGGSRLGWVITPSDTEPLVTTLETGPARLWQRAWASFIDGQALDSFHTAIVEPALAAASAFLDGAGAQLGWQVPSHPMPVLTLEFPDCDEAEGLQALASAGLLVSPGSAFGLPVFGCRVAFSGIDAKDSPTVVARLGQLIDGGLAIRPGFDQLADTGGQ
jgi:aspartate/methionine/tyrosine aminotransferase